MVIENELLKKEPENQGSKEPDIKREVTKESPRAVGKFIINENDQEAKEKDVSTDKHNEIPPTMAQDQTALNKPQTTSHCKQGSDSEIELTNSKDTNELPESSNKVNEVINITTKNELSPKHQEMKAQDKDKTMEDIQVPLDPARFDPKGKSISTGRSIAGWI